MRMFMSYRRSDSADASGRIYDRLSAHFGEEAIFKDVDDIPIGVDYKVYLHDVISSCEVELVIIGPRWLGSADESGQRRLDDPTDLVRLEIEAALNRDIPVVPVLVGGASMPGEDELPPSLKNLAYRNAMPVRADPDFHTDVNRLIRGLEGHVADRPGRVSARAEGEIRFLRRWWRLGAGLLVALAAGLVLSTEGAATTLSTLGVAVLSVGICTRYAARRRWLSSAVVALPALGWVLAWIQAFGGGASEFVSVVLYFRSYVPTVTLWFSAVTSALAAIWLAIDAFRGEVI